MGSPDDSTLSAGTMLAHYRVENQLGSGAMGTVYRAHDTSLERPVAVKVLHSKIAEEPEIVRRFEREARAAARVNHPNLTHVYFVGHDDGARFFVMEHVPGESLFEHVEAHGPVDFERMIDILVQAAKGLAAAHAGGVIHRDVKPSNLMLLPNGTVKVTDFGLAKSLQGDVDATGAGRIMGTPRYMSPEQCRGDVADARTDCYSLGLVGWFLLSGRHAFDGESLGKVINDQMNAPLPDLDDLREDLPPAAQSVLEQLCAKDPDQRPSTMQEVIGILEGVRPRALDLAPLATRTTALAIDVMSLAIPMMAMAGLFMWLHQQGLENPFLDWVGGTTVSVVIALLSIGAEWKFGGLPGKLAFGLRVVREDGTRPSPLALLWRLLLRLPLVAIFALPNWLEPLGFVILGLQILGGLSGAVCYFVLDRRTLSDVLTRTRVALHRSGDPSRRGAMPPPRPYLG
jgi:tRNA A-37 threonylcarbamoyl transferase component Bud32/uncharacterized RDD family membrane protein YckC